MKMKRSALFYCHQREGASFIGYRGWELPAFFSQPEQEAAHVREYVGLSDESYLRKFDLRKQPSQRAWRLGENHYLLLSELALDAPPGAIDVSSVYTSLRLTGPRSRDVLAKLTSLNVGELAFPNLFCAQTSIAHAHTILMREDLGPLLAFHILISRDYGESLWESILHAGDEFDISRFGLTALQSLHP